MMQAGRQNISDFLHFRTAGSMHDAAVCGQERAANAGADKLGEKPWQIVIGLAGAKRHEADRIEAEIDFDRGRLDRRLVQIPQQKPRQPWRIRARVHPQPDQIEQHAVEQAIDIIDIFNTDAMAIRARPSGDDDLEPRRPAFEIGSALASAGSGWSTRWVMRHGCGVGRRARDLLALSVG